MRSVANFPPFGQKPIVLQTRYLIGRQTCVLGVMGRQYCSYSLFSIFFYLLFCRHYCYNYLIHSSLRSDDKRYRVDTLCILLTTSGRERKISRRERKISRRKRNLLRRKKIFSRRESDGRSCRHPAFCRHVITCSVSV